MPTSRPERAPELEDLADVLPAGPSVIGLDGPPPSIDELVALGEAEPLLELGAAYRVGTPHAPRDAFKALECFEAASRLGSADAEYLVGIATIDGLGINADLAEGVKRLRSAAQRGSLRAKIYVANLYETGVYYQADREKADVWYRNVARSAEIAHAPDSPEHDTAMAELGCVRHCLKLVADDALPAKDRAFYLKKAKAMGYQHKLAQTKRTPAADEPIEARAPEAAAAPVEAPEKNEAPKPEAPAAKPEPTNEPREAMLGEQWTWGPGLVAFVGAAFFACAASAAGWLAMEGSRALAHADRPLPFVGTQHEAVFWAVVVALGVVPAASTYRTHIFAIATAAGVVVGAGAHFLWDVQHLIAHRLAQTAAGGLGAFLIVLLVLGLLGGTRARVIKREKPRLKPKPFGA